MEASGDRAAAAGTLWKQSSLGPERQASTALEELEGMDPGFKLMYLANEGDVEGIKEQLDEGISVHFRDGDDRTPLHVAACQGYVEIVELLLSRGAEVDPKDRWGSTPLADAIHYKNSEVIQVLEKHGAKSLVTPMLVKTAREVPEYEIDPKELDFTNSVDISKGTFQMASWRGIEVAVKKYGEEFSDKEDRLRAFRDELALLQKLRHPNVVQFLGAVTQSIPMMIVTEYLPKGDLRAFLDKKGALRPSTAIRFALDISRGMNYLHEHKPEAIIHRDLEPSNILRDDTRHLKVADFGVSKLLKVTKRVQEDTPLSCQDTQCRYVAPEVFSNEEYDTKVDVFSFSLILQEMIEGCRPFTAKPESDVPNVYTTKKRPPFRAPPRQYPHGLRELIEACWSEDPSKRPTFRQIIEKLECILNSMGVKRGWKVRHLRCFQNLEAIWKRDRSRSVSSRSSRSTR
ncbi:unnamed protein product [Rhodiola kirilowii]